ncbi:MAG TPA: hypothetical protein VIY96_05060 [Thermoanaerobaculia bacterium]
MRSRQITLALLAGLFLVSAGLRAACPASGTVLCLSAQRFSVEARWKDFQGNTGSGRAVTLTPDTGYFWFFSDNNVELVVKVLDARAFNGRIWVFFGALSNVEYTLTVTDTQTGAVKEYRNPSGQFASVGDTAAFTGAATGPTPSYESVTAEGTGTPPESLDAIRRFVDAAASDPASEIRTKKAATFTPCPGPSTSLFLSNCRFELTVQWTDFQGRSGAGRAVQLTSDTGYFWFFSDNNVELIAKVLDARSFNQKFWVFYGALSNVEYALHVRDTVSGALRIYRNPSSNFASVGDTSAFRGGHGIAVNLDSARAASGAITAATGGTLSATAANGTVFTLAVPPHALVAATTITMTPVSSIDHLPFSGGLVAAVSLEPSGLHLMSGARLTIRTPSPTPQSEETAFAWNGTGEDFFLYPPVAAGGDLQMYVLRLGGYGVGRGSDAERQTQAGREPPGEADRLSHRMAPLLREGRAEARGGTAARVATPNDWRLGLKLLMDESYSPPGALRDRMETCFGYPDDVIGLISEVTAWIVNVELNLGPLDSVFPGRRAEIRRLMEAMLLRALEIIHVRCVADVTEIRDLPRILGLARFLGINLQRAAETALKCLSFRLSFDTTIVSNRPGGGSLISVAETAKATVLLKFQQDLSDPEFDFPKLKGEGLTLIENIQAGHLPAECQVTVGPSQSGTFRAELDLPTLDLFASTVLVTLYYDVGYPTASLTVHDCKDPRSGETVPPFTVMSSFSSDYYVLHESEVDDVSGYLYHAYTWTPTGDRDPWAFAAYTGGRTIFGTLYTEDTLMKLTHTPE